MIKFLENENGIDITYNDKIILSHSKKRPIFYLGYGEAEIESYRGNFDIEDYIEVRMGLDSYRLIDDGIVFYHYDIELYMFIKEVSGRLELSFVANPEYNRFWMRLHADSQEKVYGCGEQASYFNLRGRNFPLWTSEPGVGRDKSSLTTFYADLHDRAGGDYYNTYYPETTFVSTRKYWLHAFSYAYAEFNFKNKKFHELYFWEIPKKVVISFEETYLDLVNDLTDMTERPPKLPEYVLDGIILGVQGGMEKVKEYLESAKDKDINVSGLWCQDWAGHKYTSFGKRLFWNWTLNETYYPDLEKEIKDMEKEGVHFLTYICPFLLEEQSLFNEARENEYLAFNDKQEVYLVDFGEFYCGIVDLTNQDAFDWYKDVIKKNIIDLGIKGWMADFGEYLPIDAVLSNGQDATKLHNEWPVLWARCNYEAVEESGKLGEVFYFMRSGSYGSQHYASALWAGDQSVNWELHDGIPSTVPSALSTGIIGNPFTHSDIGGYTSLHGNIRTKELFERWLEMNVFTSIMRTHEGNRPAENFQFYENDETLELMSRMTKVRKLLKPYLKHLIDEGADKGYPVQRPLFMHYEEDEKAYDIQYSYLLGSDVLVSPVLEEGLMESKVYLPEDDWVHLWTGKHFTGEQEAIVASPIGFPPVFYRRNSQYKEIFEAITIFSKEGVEICQK